MKSSLQQLTDGHNEAHPGENKEEEQSVIPLNYRGLTSEIVEELWQIPIYTDKDKNISAMKRRQNALEEIKRQEQDKRSTRC